MNTYHGLIIDYNIFLTIDENIPWFNYRLLHFFSHGMKIYHGLFINKNTFLTMVWKKHGLIMNKNTF